MPSLPQRSGEYVVEAARQEPRRRVERPADREVGQVAVEGLRLVLEVDAVVVRELAAVDPVAELLRRVHPRDHGDPAVRVVLVVEVARVALAAAPRVGLVRHEPRQVPVRRDHRAQVGAGDQRREADAVDGVAVVGVVVVRAADRIFAAGVVLDAHAPVVGLAAELEDAQRHRDLGPRALDDDRVAVAVDAGHRRALRPENAPTGGRLEVL